MNARLESEVQDAAIRHAPLRPPHRLKMGMSFLQEPSTWLVPDRDRRSDLEHKRALYARQPHQVFVEESDSRAAQCEVRDEVIAHVQAHFTDGLRRDEAGFWVPGVDAGPIDPSRPPLLQASWLVQEDLCLMQRDAGGRWRLTAASVCFPSRWDLPSKLGDTLAGIHRPVPGYGHRLARSAEQFFDRLRYGRIAVRANWSLMDAPQLFQPTVMPSHERGTLTVDNVGQRVVLRTERQTLRRLAHSDAILFTIRTFRDRLHRLRAHPDAARDLAEELRTLPSDLAIYKAIPALRTPVLAWLDRVVIDSSRRREH